MAKPKPGETYRLTGDDIGVDPGRIRTGTVVEVRELVTAKTPGAHDDSEDAVVVEIEEPTLTFEGGKPTVGYTRRATSFGLDFFGENFERGN